MADRPSLEIPKQLLPPGTKVRVLLALPGFSEPTEHIGFVQHYECYSPNQRTFPVQFGGGYFLMSLRDVEVVKPARPDNVTDIEQARSARRESVEVEPKPRHEVG